MRREVKQRQSIRALLLIMMGVFSLLISPHLYAQDATITVKGNVRDDLGETVIGASVIVKGKPGVGTITDTDGNFTLKAPRNTTLVVSFIGYKSQEFIADDRSTVNIKLEEDSELLSEVVVIGYGSVRKEDLTGSVVAIKAEDKNRGAITSPQELIQGKVPGVFVLPGSGQPGGGATMRIRSGASLNASNDPLIVIDGVPVGNDAAPGMANPLSSVNPNDIETFTVLKDASATAIYGSRASNGVILITTKKGGKEKVKVSYSGTFSVNDPTKQTKVLNASQYREVMTDNYGDNAEVMGYLNQYPDTSTDWQDLIFRTALATDHNLSFAGTALNLPYRVSVGYKNEDGTLKTSNYERYTADLSLNPKFLDDHLTVNLNLKGSINNNTFANADAVGRAAFFDPTKPVYNDSGDFNGYWNWTTKGNINTEASNNPLQTLLDRFDSGKTKRSMGNIQLDYKLHWLPDLRLNLNLGYDVAKGEGDKGPNIGSYDAAKDALFKGVGTRESWNKFRRNQLMEYYMNYDKELDKIDSRFNVMGGYSWQWFYYSDLTKNYSPIIAGYPAKEDSGWIKDDVAGEYVKKGSIAKPGENYLISFFGRMNYTFKNKYMLTATLRRDGSSKFHKDHRWGTFPSLAAAWTITGEEFMKGADILSNLKLRIGYGKTGQQEMNDYQYINNYQTGTNPSSIYLGEYLMKPLKYNPNLKWETTDTYNIALDYGFWNNRINGSIEYYKKKTSDLLSEVNTPAGTNFSNKLMANIGNMENNGVEFNINAVVVDTKDWGWDVGFNATWNKSKITKLVQKDNDSYPGMNEGFAGLGTGSYTQKNIVGYAPYTFYLFEQVYGEDGKPIQNAFVDRDGDGKITDGDRYLKHNPMPDAFFGFSSQVRYKKFDLGFNLRANVGNYVYNEVAAMNSTIASAFGGQGFLTNLHSTIYDTNFRLSNTSEQSKSDYFVENASFLKMDNLTLGYNFQNILWNKLSGRLSFSVQNVFTITDYSGLDPENSGVEKGKMGLDRNIWPRPRTYTVGLNLNF